MNTHLLYTETLAVPMGLEIVSPRRIQFSDELFEGDDMLPHICQTPEQLTIPYMRLEEARRQLRAKGSPRNKQQATSNMVGTCVYAHTIWLDRSTSPSLIPPGDV